MSKLDTKIEKVAKQVIETLSDEDKKYICEHPNPITYHFTLGLYIRNKYIYDNSEFEGYPMADDISNMIIEKIILELTGKEPVYDIDIYQ